jgi:hypothetical protein
MDITVSKSRKWSKNYLEALTTQGDILKKYKKKFNAKIVTLFDNDLKCTFPAKIRISGDHKDHMTPSISSLDVKLLDGNINSTIKFKLFIPQTKGGDNEIVSTTLLKELGFLAPKTYYVPSTFNGQSTIFLFQEKITKEFIESNNLREAPILEGDERFFFDNVEAGFNRFGLARILNKNWTKKGFVSLGISKTALSRLNRSYLELLSGRHIHMNADLFMRPNAFLNKLFTNNDNKFDAILIAIGAAHALYPNNRKFYYDPMYEYIKPIYYDGNSIIVQLEDSMEQFMNLENKLKNSIINGSKLAIISLNNLDRAGFNNKLNTLGLEYSLSKINIIINKVIENLKLMANYPISKTTKNTYTPYFSIYNNLHEYTKKLVFSTTKDLRIEVCDLLLISCFYKNLDIESYSILLNGSYKDYDNNDYIFIGNKEEYTLGLSKKKSNKVNRFDIDNGVEMYTYGYPEVSIDKTNKKIVLHQKKNKDRILIKGGRLSDWHIKFIGSIDKKNKDEQRFNKNMLTGCLTLLDMQINKVSIDIDSASCEDGLNLIRVNGNLSSVAIKNVLSDAIDSDFSKLHFKNIKVNNAGNDCIDLSSGDYYIEHAELIKCMDKAISVGEKSNLTVEFSQISESNIGIAAKDSSVAKVNHVIANEVMTCFSSYNKKQEFWGGKITVKKHNCQSNKFFQEEGSLIEFIQ